MRISTNRRTRIGYSYRSRGKPIPEFSVDDPWLPEEELRLFICFGNLDREVEWWSLITILPCIPMPDYAYRIRTGGWERAGDHWSVRIPLKDKLAGRPLTV